MNKLVEFAQRRGIENLYYYYIAGSVGQGGQSRGFSYLGLSIDLGF